MPSDRTFVTELSTALGTLGHDELATAIGRRPPQMANLTRAHWDHLDTLWGQGAHTDDFLAGFSNGAAFLAAPDALNGRRPRIVEWTGGRRALGDEAVPSDLRIDHVYLVSCKYLSRILHNPSPARLVEGLLAPSAVEDAGDWYQRVAPCEYHDLYGTCVASLDDHRSGPSPFPASVSELTAAQRRSLAGALRGGWPPGAEERYQRLCEVVSQSTARMWNEHITGQSAELMLWRILRIGAAPYFILGTSTAGSMRLRIDSPWDWRRTWRLRRFVVHAQPGGQPRVRWAAEYEERSSSRGREVSGHVEIRWSHGRFAQPPEAKVYLDSPHEEVPGYHPLESARLRAVHHRPTGGQDGAPDPQQGRLWAGAGEQ